MFKLFLFSCAVCSFVFAMPVFAQSPVEPSANDKNATTDQAQPAKSVEQPQTNPSAEETVKGIIKEIAADGSYIVIDDKKIMITKELLEDSYLEVGDKVEVITEKTAAGLQAKTCNYIFEEETNPSRGEVAPGTETQP